MDNEFYDSIVYKKNVYQDLQEDLAKYYLGRKVLLISSKSVAKHNNFTEVMNSISLAKCSFKHYVAKNGFSLVELREISEILTCEKFDLIISFGSGKTTNVCKYFACMFNIPYMLCPTSVSCFNYFNGVCINPFDASRSFVCDVAERIYISECMIKLTPQKLVKQAIYSLLSLYEYITTNSIENILLGTNTNLKELMGSLKKLKEELNAILSGDIDAKLKLMDIIIDVSYCMQKIDLFKNATFNLSLILIKMHEDKNEYIGGGEINLIAAKTILLSYLNLFSQNKIKQVAIPCYEEIAEKIINYSIFTKKTNGYVFFNKIISKQSTIKRLNNLKEEFRYQCGKAIKNIDNIMAIIKSYNEVFDYNLPQIRTLFDAYKMMPFITENNIIINMLCGMGYINAF